MSKRLAAVAAKGVGLGAPGGYDAMVRSRRLVGVAAVVAAALGMAGAAPATADAGPGTQPPSAGVPESDGPTTMPGATETKKVTLITGDQVWLTRSTDEAGKKSVRTRIVPAKRADGRIVSFAQSGTADQYFVVPSDVLPLLGSRVDREIFDVAGLIDSGASESPETRVIVSFKGSASGLEAASSVVSAKANATDTTVLASANAVALKVPAGKGAGLFDELETASSGQAYVSLDGRVKALDATSMPQIGAPKAWESGYTGKGIKVAVLDTGIDTTHPDLMGQVSAAKDFSGSGSTTDRFGHGTHVASIVAGTGKAGGPKMRGVAYEAKLLNAKVLDDDGYGSESDIIRGMEWAARSGADVVNMSLGGGPGNGTDPMEKSVDALSKKYGTVFAIAAGNSGEEGNGLVSSPSTAASAISVAAVDARNSRAPFSDTGPGRGNGALKPDVSAPGVNISGARSKVNVWDSGSSNYVKLSGTSMAAPHVAGAAALLAQARPELNGSELKSVLMGGAINRYGNVWEEGAGVIDIPRSIDMPVFAEEGSLSFGIVPFPHSKARVRFRTIRYRNTSDTPVTMSLEQEVTDLGGYKSYAIDLSRSRLTVPAKGTAKVRVSLDPRVDSTGKYAGAITATPYSGHAIRTTLGWTNDVQRFDVKIKAVDRSGKAANGLVDVFAVRSTDDEEKPFYTSVAIQGQDTLRLPAGSYFAGGFVFPKSRARDETTLALEPRFTVAGNTLVDLDARIGQRTQVTTPKPSKLTYSSVLYSRASDDYDPMSVGYGLGGEKGANWWVTPTKSTYGGRSWFSEFASLNGPGADPAYNYQAAYFTSDQVPPSLKHTITASEVATSVGTLRSRVKGTAALTWSPVFRGQRFADTAGQEVTVPGAVTTYLVGEGARWFNDVGGPATGGRLEGDWWASTRGRRFVPGSTTPSDYFTGVMSPGAVNDGVAFRFANKVAVSMPVFEDSSSRGGHGSQSTKQSLTAYVGNKKRAGSKSGAVVFPVRDAKSVRLVHQVSRKANWWGWTTSSTGEWTAPIPSANARTLPLMDIQYKVPGQANDGSVAPGEQAVDLTVTQVTRPKYFRSGLISPRSLKLEFSVDGGKTWREARLTKKWKKSTAIFTPPAPKPGHTTKVSLRAFASDGKGSTVKETMISAYEIAGVPPAPVVPRR